jgi:hypothetical protein
MSTRIGRAAVAAALAGALAGGAWAQAGGPWNSIGPPGGTVSALLTSPVSATTLFAGTPQNGVFLSDDAGATWSAANTGLSASTATGRQSLYSVYSLASDGRFVYAATAAGIFFSTASTAPVWTALPGPGSATPITLLAFDAGSNRLFAASGQTDGVAAPGVYITPIDNSAAPAPAWSFAALPAPPGTVVDALALVPAQASGTPAAVLASAGGKPYTASILPSILGLAWNDGDPAGTLSAGSITAIAYSAEFLKAYACSGGGAFYSGNPLDASPIWLPAVVSSPNAIPFNCHGVASVPIAVGGAPQVVLATDEGVFVSVDGLDFLATGSLGLAPSALAFAIGSGPGMAASTLFVASGFGVASAAVPSLAAKVGWVSNNGPSTVAAGGANGRLNNANIIDSAMLGASLYAAAVDNAYVEVLSSPDLGATWTGTNLSSAVNAGEAVVSLQADAAHGLLYAATTQGLLVYTPASGQWSTVATTTIAGRVGALALGTSALFVGTDNGLWAVPLVAAPATAVPVAAGLNGSKVRSLLLSGGTVYAGTIDANAENFVFSASEASATAGTAVWSAFASSSAGTDRITALLPVTGGLLAATNGSLLLYATAGSGWASGNTSADLGQQISDAFGVVNGLYSDGVSIYASTGSNGVFVSPLATTFSWTPFSGSGGTSLPSMEVHTLRASGTTLYAATRGGIASFSGIADSGGGGAGGGSGGGGGTVTPPATGSSGTGGGAVDPAFFLVLLGGVWALRARRPRQTR